MRHVMHCCAAVAATLLAGAATAHHSDSLYFVDDRGADGGAIRIEGTISRVRWINPHSEFFVDVPSATGGEAATWAIETDSVNQLRGLGWNDKTLEVGDKVVVVVSKSKFDDTAGLTATGSTGSTSRGMSETGGGNASLGRQSGGSGMSTTASGRGRAKSRPTT